MILELAVALEGTVLFGIVRHRFLAHAGSRRSADERSVLIMSTGDELILFLKPVLLLVSPTRGPRVFAAWPQLVPSAWPHRPPSLTPGAAQSRDRPMARQAELKSSGATPRQSIVSGSRFGGWSKASTGKLMPKISGRRASLGVI